MLVAGKNGKARRDFSGRLPFDWPVDARSPITQPLFPAGYGLTYKSRATIGAVNEDPRVDLAASASEKVYLRKGVPPSPWRLGLDSAVVGRAVDLDAQEDAQQLRWSGAGSIAIDGPPVRLTQHAANGEALKIDWRIDQPTTTKVHLSLAGVTVDLSPNLNVQPGTRVSTLIPLRCFTAAGANLDAVGTPVRLSGDKGLTVTWRDVHIVVVDGQLPCPTNVK